VGIHLEADFSRWRFSFTEFAPFVDSSESDTYEGYLERMKEETAWGSQIEIQALSQLFHLDFDIYTDDAQCQLLTLHNGGKQTVALAYSGGNHYDIVYPQSHFQALTVSQSIMMLILEATFVRLSGSTKAVTLNPLPKNYKYDNIGLRIWKSSMSRQTKKDRKIARRLQDFTPEASGSNPANADPANAAPANSKAAAVPDKAVALSSSAGEGLRESDGAASPQLDRSVTLSESSSAAFVEGAVSDEQELSDALLAAALQQQFDAEESAEEEPSSPSPQNANGWSKKRKGKKNKNKKMVLPTQPSAPPAQPAAASKPTAARRSPAAPARNRVVPVADNANLGDEASTKDVLKEASAEDPAAVPPFRVADRASTAPTSIESKQGDADSTSRTGSVGGQENQCAPKKPSGFRPSLKTSPRSVDENISNPNLDIDVPANSDAPLTQESELHSLASQSTDAPDPSSPQQHQEQFYEPHYPMAPMYLGQQQQQQQQQQQYLMYAQAYSNAWSQAHYQAYMQQQYLQMRHQMTQQQFYPPAHPPM
jgi:hypothetical protein